MPYSLHCELFLPLPRATCFAFFADAGNLPRITPPWLGFQILTPQPIDIKTGSLIDYRIRWLGFPVRWRTIIEAYEPPVRFIDRQLKGPYILWRHEHTFEERDGGTWMVDHVDYQLPFGWLGNMAHFFMVRRQLEGIFAYRQKTISELLLGPSANV